MTLLIQVNGEPYTLDGPTTVRQLVERLVGDADQPGIAVARNGEVVPRTKWAESFVKEKDAIDVLRPTSGG